MPFERSTALPAILLLMASAAFAQTEGPAPGSPCRVTPGEPQEEDSLTETLDECNGVLKPPKVGDPGIVEQAPDVGDTPVIPPGVLPDQPAQDVQESRDDESMAQPGYTVGQIIDAISRSDNVAEKMSSVDTQAVEVRDVSILLDGVDAAVINTSLSVHGTAVDRLQGEMGRNSHLVTALQAAGLTPAGVLAVDMDASDTIIIFAR